MKIVVIGAGNVATHLAAALYNKGFNICQVFSRTEESAISLAKKVNAGYTTCLSDVNKSADIYLYSISDSILPDLVSEIRIPDAIHIHTSGSTAMDIFRGNAVNFGVLYPLQTFSKAREVNFSVIPLFIEANNEYTYRKLEALALSLSSDVYEMSSERRKKLHLSAVFACNFVNHMYEIGSELVQDAGVDFDILQPLIKETYDKIKTMTPREAQTGPAIRNDRNIIETHMKLLNGKRNLAKIYELISNDIYSIHKKQ